MQWDFSVISSHMHALLTALLVNLYLSAAGIAIGTVVGMGLAICALSPTAWLRVPSRIIVEIFLAVPVLVLIVWLYYCLPLLHNSMVLTGPQAAIAGLGLSLGAFVSEIMRAGIEAVPRGQLEVAYCTGMSKSQALRYILFPQVFRRSWPPLMGQYITCYKMSTLASIVAVEELLHTGGTIISQTYRPLELYTAIAVLFIVTVIPLNSLTRRIQKSSRAGGTTTV